MSDNRRITASLLAAGRGFAIGMLAATIACAIWISRGVHTGHRLADVTVGVAAVALGLFVVFLVLRVSGALLAFLLRRLARRLPRRSARVAILPLPLVRLVGRPLVATTLGIGLLLWATPYRSYWYFEIPIVAGALVGLLAGVAWQPLRAWLRGGASRSDRIVAVGAGILAVTLALGVGSWCILPGAGDPIIREAAGATARIPVLDLPDPSLYGPYRVVEGSYGAGTDLHRPEYGTNVTWRTETVDAADALPTKDPLAKAYSDWYWGFDATRLPINGLVWYPPDARGPLPLVLIVHGNHDAEEYSDPGYAYLAENLASHGMIAVSVDENFLNGDISYDYAGAEMGVRAWLLLRHAAQFAMWNATAGHPLAGRVDLDRVALVGHSRGGEAVAAAAMFEARGFAPPGLSAVPSGIGIAAVVAIAPSDTMYPGPGAPIALEDVDYLVMQGARDGDLAAFDGLGMYHRLTFSGQGNHLKVALYSGRANHGRFNSVWDVGDAGLAAWMLDRGSLLSALDQQRLAKTAIGAFLARSLLGETAYDAFFREPRTGRAWLPDDVIETHWESSARTLLVSFESAPGAGAGNQAEGFSELRTVDPRLRDGPPQGDQAALLRWHGPASLALSVVKHTSSVSAADALVFALASADETPSVDPVVELRLRDGGTASLRLSEVAMPRPLLPAQIWKLPVLGDRYVPDEQQCWPAERFPQTYELPLARFPAARRLTTGDIAAVTFRFEGTGAAFLDDIAFEPGVDAGQPGFPAGTGSTSTNLPSSSL